jgi:hypothetical protein
MFPDGQNSICADLFCINKAFAQKNSLGKSGLVARGLATFLEIGRNKDVSNARRINAEDSSYIYIAQDNLKDIYRNAFIISRSEQWADEEFFKLLLDQYKNMEELLGELSIYKKFHASELAAVKLDKMAELPPNSLLLNWIKWPNWQRNTLKYGKIFHTQILKKNPENI